MSATTRTAKVNATEGHIVIGKDRLITVPNSLKRIAVQYDHNIESVTFDCPRYWDSYDMSEMTVYINYLCPKGASGVFKATNVVADKYRVDIMHFDWDITKNLTMDPGKISFQVCIKKADENGNEKHHWNSEICKDCYVSESLNCEPEEVTEVYPDLFEQWHNELMGMCETGEFDGPPGVSPTVEVVQITGGHRITITDVNGSQQFDVMDTYINTTEGIAELLNEFATVSIAEPVNGPAIWFNVDDPNSSSGTLKIKDSKNNVRIFYPVTKPENVFENGIAPIANGGTGANNAETARANLGVAAENHRHEDTERTLDELASCFENSAVKIQNGGTGASDAETARANLGVAAENHTHEDMEQTIATLGSYFIDGAALRLHMKSCDNTDFDTLVEHSVYYGSVGMINAAVNDISVLEVIPFNQDWVLQRQTVITTDIRTCSTYVRFKQGGTWSIWKRQLTNIMHPDDYGDTPPTVGHEGQIFYRKVSS